MQPDSSRVARTPIILGEDEVDVRRTDADGQQLARPNTDVQTELAWVAEHEPARLGEGAATAPGRRRTLRPRCGKRR